VPAVKPSTAALVFEAFEIEPVSALPVPEADPTMAVPAPVADP
jgi:hypothetical protein